MIIDINKTLFIDVLLFITRMLAVFIMNIEFVVDAFGRNASFKLIPFEFVNEIH